MDSLVRHKTPELWALCAMRPHGVTTEHLGIAPHIRQCRVLGWASSRVGFARLLHYSGFDVGASIGQLSREIRDFGSTTANAHELATVPIPKHGDLPTVWLSPLDGYRHNCPILPFTDGHLVDPGTAS